MRPAVLAALAIASLPLAGFAANEVPTVSPAPVPAGEYTIDKAHTSLIFKVSHLGFSTYVGRFTRFDAKLQFDPGRIAASRVDVTIDPRSIEADNAPSGFLQTLAGKDWLDADRFPKMSFVSQTVVPTGANTFRIRGALTLHGVSKPITLEVRYNGGYAGHTYESNARIGFSAQGSFKRSDFGISTALPDPGSSFGVGDEVSVALESEFTGPPLAATAKASN